MPRVVKRSAYQTVKVSASRHRQPNSALPQFVPPQLSKPVEKPPSGPQWLHEIKLDGYRMAARLDNGRVQLLTRTGLDWSDKYPSVTAALANVNAKTAYNDGEPCGVDAAGLPSFAQTQAATDGECGVHLIYYAFYLLHLDGWDLSSLPLTRRKELLEPMVTNKAGVQFSGHDTGDGELILKHAGKLGFEGVVSKTIDAPYALGNRGLWRKAKALGLPVHERAPGHVSHSHNAHVLKVSASGYYAAQALRWCARAARSLRRDCAIAPPAAPAPRTLQTGLSRRRPRSTRPVRGRVGAPAPRSRRPRSSGRASRSAIAFAERPTSPAPCDASRPPVLRTPTNRIEGRVTAWQIAAASVASFFCRRTYGFT